MSFIRDGTSVKFIAGTPVTDTNPEVDPGQWVYDTGSHTLYLDLLEYDDYTGQTTPIRTQITDPLKLSLTGGTLTGDLLISDDGTVTTRLWRTGGVETNGFYICTAEIHASQIPDSVAVWVSTENGNQLQSRTLRELFSDLDLQISGSLDDENLTIDIESGLPED